MICSNPLCDFMLSFCSGKFCSFHVLEMIIIYKQVFFRIMLWNDEVLTTHRLTHRLKTLVRLFNSICLIVYLYIMFTFTFSVTMIPQTGVEELENMNINKGTDKHSSVADCLIRNTTPINFCFFFIRSGSRRFRPKIHVCFPSPLHRSEA